jgi:hypothetical protein
MSPDRHIAGFGHRLWQVGKWEDDRGHVHILIQPVPVAISKAKADDSSAESILASYNPQQMQFEEAEDVPDNFEYIGIYSKETVDQYADLAEHLHGDHPNAVPHDTRKWGEYSF